MHAGGASNCLRVLLPCTHAYYVLCGRGLASCCFCSMPPFDLLLTSDGGVVRPVLHVRSAMRAPSCRATTGGSRARPAPSLFELLLRAQRAGGQMMGGRVGTAHARTAGSASDILRAARSGVRSNGQSDHDSTWTRLPLLLPVLPQQRRRHYCEPACCVKRGRIAYYHLNIRSTFFRILRVDDATQQRCNPNPPLRIRSCVAGASIPPRSSSCALCDRCTICA